jgi:hypothetical protein
MRLMHRSINNERWKRYLQLVLSPPGGYLNHTMSDSSSSSNTTATAVVTGVAAAPTNALDGSNRNCSLWYTVGRPFV